MDVLMKHMLFLRRQRNLCGHIWRWPSLPSTAGQRARRAERALPSQPRILSRPPPCLAPPPPQHTVPQSSYCLRRLSWHRHRWQMAKGTRKYKGGPDSNLELANNQPRNSAAYAAGRVKAGTPRLLRRLSQVRLLLSASPRVSARETRSPSDPQAPALLGRKPGNRHRTPGHRSAPAAPHQDRRRPRPDRRAGKGGVTQSNGGLRAAPRAGGKPSAGAALAGTPVPGAQEGRSRPGREPSLAGGARGAPRRGLTCERLLKRPAEHLEPLLAHTAPRPQEAGQETHGGGDLREHVRPLAGPAGRVHLALGGARQREQ